MAAVLTATGTWSTIATAAKPTLVGGGRENVERRYETNSLNYEAAVNGGYGVNGYDEIIAFIGLVAAGYSIPWQAAKQLVFNVIASMETGEEPSQLRAYP